MDLISVIIPYHKKKYIQKTLKSVINQSYKKIEIIIIYDDNDRTDLSFVRSLIKKDKRLKLLINKNNLGAGKSRNKGIKKAKGKYVSFIDADDLWKKDKLKIQIDYMKKNKVTFLHSSYEIIDFSGKILGSRRAKNYDNFYNLVKSCDIGLSTVTIKRKIFLKI